MPGKRKRKEERSYSKNSKSLKKTRATSKKINKKKDLSESPSKAKTENKNSKEDTNITNLINMKDITEKLGNSKIFCREEEKKVIMKFIKNKEKDKKTLFISGQPGTGKTSLVNEIFNVDLKKDENFFIKFSINCLSISSTEDFYEAIFKFLNDAVYYNYFMRTFDKKKVEEIIKLLKKTPNENNFNKLLDLLNKTTFTIALDEIDFLYKKTKDYLFFGLLSIPYLLKSDVKMILISNNSDFDNEIFPILKNRNITIQKLVFKPYTHKELTQIMTLKLEAIDLLQYFTNDAIRFLSTKMNKSGDIRPIISIIKELILNNRNKLKKDDFKIELKNMFDIIKKKNISLNEILSSITTEQKIVVAALYYVCKGKGIKLEEKEIFEKYKNIKQYTNTPELNTEEFRDVLKTFIDIGLIEPSSSSNKGKKSKSTIVYKAKYSDEDLELIFEDPLIFSLFNSNQEEEDEKIEHEDK